MTLEEWNALAVGDVLIDRSHGDALRTIYAVTRHRGKQTQRGLTRTCLTVTSLKSKGGGGRTHVFASENGGPVRFDLHAKARP